MSFTIEVTEPIAEKKMIMYRTISAMAIQEHIFPALAQLDSLPERRGPLVAFPPRTRLIIAHGRVALVHSARMPRIMDARASP